MSPSVSTQETLPAREPEVTESTGGDQNWLALVESIQRSDPNGMEGLYTESSRGVFVFICAGSWDPRIWTIESTIHF